MIVSGDGKEEIKVIRLAAAHDYEVNFKAELEILSLHEKSDGLCEMNWQGRW